MTNLYEEALAGQDAATKDLLARQTEIVNLTERYRALHKAASAATDVLKELEPSLVAIGLMCKEFVDIPHVRLATMLAAAIEMLADKE